MKFRDINNWSKQCRKVQCTCLFKHYYLNYTNTRYIWYLKHWQVAVSTLEGYKVSHKISQDQITMLMQWSFLYLLMGAPWDNFNLSLKTLDGKGNLHVSVGILYQNVSSENNSSSQEIEPVIWWPHRISECAEKLILLFLTNIKLAKLVFTDKNMDRHREFKMKMLLKMEITIKNVQLKCA